MKKSKVLQPVSVLIFTSCTCHRFKTKETFACEVRIFFITKTEDISKQTWLCQTYPNGGYKSYKKYILGSVWYCILKIFFKNLNIFSLI